MKRFTLIALGAAAALSVVAQSAVAQTKEIKLGCYVPLTGQLAIFGQSMDNGFKLAIKDFEASGKRKGTKFVIQCEDDQGRPDDGINIARKFVEDKSILAVLGSWSSSVTLAAGPIYNSAKLVNITPISSHPDVTKVGPYVFRQSIIQSKEGAANGAYLHKLGVKTIAMLGIPNDYGKANIAFTKSAFEKLGGKVVFEEMVRPDAQDFRQVLQKAVREKPDMVYIGVFAPQAALMLKQMRQLGINTPVYAAAALDTPDLVRLAGKDATEGVHLTIQFNPVVGPKMAEFFKHYEATYGKKPDPFAGNSYNTAMMMMRIVASQYPSVNRESIRTGLDAMREDKDSIFGPLKYDPETREWQFHLRSGVIKDGQTQVIE